MPTKKRLTKKASSSKSNYTSFIKKIEFPLLTFIFSRLAIFLLAFVFINLFPARSHPSFLEAFSQWDGQWYLRILQGGYWYKGPNIQSPVAFFPLYPLLGKPLTLLGVSPAFSLFLVANVCCLGFFVIFWLWTKKIFDQKVADKALFFYAISPLSFLFSSLYTESLFLLLCCGVFYLLEEKHLFSASLLAGLASATRPFGVMLALPIFWVALKERKFSLKLLLWPILSCLGLIFFSLYLKIKVGEFAPFLAVKMVAWHHFWTFPWSAIALFVKSLLVIPSANPFFGMGFFDLMMVILFSVLLVYSIKRISFSYAIFMWQVYFLSICQPWSLKFFLPSGSISRYLFQLFPLIALGAKLSLKNQVLDNLITFFFISLNGVFALAFFHGLWVQ